MDVSDLDDEATVTDVVLAIKKAVPSWCEVERTRKTVSVFTERRGKTETFLMVHDDRSTKQSLRDKLAGYDGEKVHGLTIKTDVRLPENVCTQVEKAAASVLL